MSYINRPNTKFKKEFTTDSRRFAAHGCASAAMTRRSRSRNTDWFLEFATENTEK